jgi:hypothetical protein
MASKGKSPKPESPSKGTQLAREIREKANTLTDAERENALHRGLSLIYAKGKKTEVNADRH